MLMGKTRRETELFVYFSIPSIHIIQQQIWYFPPYYYNHGFRKRSTTDGTFMPFCAKVILLRACQWKNLGKWGILYKNHIQISFQKLKLKSWHTFNSIRFGKPNRPYFLIPKVHTFHLYYYK